MHLCMEGWIICVLIHVLLSKFISFVITNDVRMGFDFVYGEGVSSLL